MIPAAFYGSTYEGEYSGSKNSFQDGLWSPDGGGEVACREGSFKQALLISNCALLQQHFNACQVDEIHSHYQGRSAQREGENVSNKGVTEVSVWKNINKN